MGVLLIQVWLYYYYYHFYKSLSIKRCTTLCDNVCLWFATGQWFSTGPPVSSTNKTDRHDITEILLKVALSTIKQTNKQTRGHLSYKTTFSLSQRVTSWYRFDYIIIIFFYNSLSINNFMQTYYDFIFRRISQIDQRSECTNITVGSVVCILEFIS